MAPAKHYQTVKQFYYMSEKLKDMGYWRNLETCRSKAKELRRSCKLVKEGIVSLGTPGQPCTSLKSLTSSSAWTWSGQILIKWDMCLLLGRCTTAPKDTEEVD